MSGFLLGHGLAESCLLDFGFLVLDVLARFRIKLRDRHFFWHGALVLGGGVKVTGAGGRLELDFFAAFAGCHDVFSYSLI